MSEVGIAGTVNENTGRKCLCAVFVVYQHVGNLVSVLDTAGQIGMHVHIHTGFEDHALRLKFVVFRLEGDIGQRAFYFASVDLGQSVHEFPRDAAVDKFSVI